MKIEQLARNEVMNAIITGELDGIYICHESIIESPKGRFVIHKIGEISVDMLHLKLTEEDIGFLRITEEDKNEA